MVQEMLRGSLAMKDILPLQVKGTLESIQQLHQWWLILVKCTVEQILGPLSLCWVGLVSKNIQFGFFEDGYFVNELLF